jgi:hypothetical protein
VLSSKWRIIQENSVLSKAVALILGGFLQNCYYFVYQQSKDEINFEFL